jgi:hypothetical protein
MRLPFTGSLKSLTKGFLAATSLIWLFNVFALFRSGDSWLASLYLLILLIPVSSLTCLNLKKTKPQPAPDASAKWRNLVFSFQGIALAFWIFDLATTFYAINITGLAVELNPLGWPLGILGALAFYGPSLIFSYILLFKIKESIGFYAAMPLTMLALGMGAMNLNAGTQNFQVFVDTTTLATGIRYALLALIVAVNFAVPLTLKRIVASPKVVLS